MSSKIFKRIAAALIAVLLLVAVGSYLAYDLLKKRKVQE